MFVWSIKASTFKLVGVVVISAAVLALLIGIIPSVTLSSVETGVAVINSELVFDGVETSADVAEFAKQFNIYVGNSPCETVELRIPQKFDAVLEKYNEIQKNQGLNLEKYKNKQVKRYTYAVLDDKGSETGSYLSIIVYKNRVVAGDISNNENGGFVSGFIV